VIALDRSAKMLDEARKKEAARLNHLRASGESLPLRDSAIDMVFMSMVFHHFRTPASVARECRRVLGRDRLAMLRAATTEQINNYAYVPFFPGSRPLLERSLCSRTLIESTFVSAGFELQSHELVESEAGNDWSDYADRLSLRADSILAQLDNSEFEQGLENLRTFARSAPAVPVVEPVDFFVFRTV